MLLLLETLGRKKFYCFWRTFVRLDMQKKMKEDGNVKEKKQNKMKEKYLEDMKNFTSSIF